MDIPFTLATTGILAVIFFGHSLRIINGRKLTKTNLGDGGHELMTRRIRIHGNFAEYVPILVLILLMMELQGVPPSGLAVFSLAIIAGRCLHAYGLSNATAPMWARIFGMQLTLWPLLIGGLYLVWLSLI